MEFYSKAKNLSLLKKRIKEAVVLNQISFRASDFPNRWEIIKKLLIEKGWDQIDVIVRSSSYNEDRMKHSFAGKYLSLRAKGIDEVRIAINNVVVSMEDGNGKDEVFIQPYIANIRVNGVAFGVDPKSRGNYMVIEINDNVSSEMFVTAGKSTNDQLFYFYDRLDYLVQIKNNNLKQVIALVHEVESVFNTKKVDVEFVIDSNGIIYLLQVRPLNVQLEMQDTSSTITETLKNLQEKFIRDNNLLGDNNVLAMMTDWNPAEIIGVRPNKLAFSLYNKLLLKESWEIGRARYGYHELKNKELMINVLGSPYIDVKKSFNSLLPKGLPQGIAEKVVCFYLKKLRNNPLLHDKVEFDIVYSCFTFDNDFSELKNIGLSEEEIDIFTESLRALTNNVISSELIYEDYKKSKKLNVLRKHIKENDNYGFIEKVNALLDSCIEYGTIPFSGVARAAFIAEKFLRSFVSSGVFVEEDYIAFKEGNSCITSQMLLDLNEMETVVFLEKYGHLRPGTYDIIQKRYDEHEMSDVIGSNRKKEELKHQYIFSDKQILKIEKLIKLNHFSFSANKLISFISDSMRYREEIKFEFTKNISEVLSVIKDMAYHLGYTVEEVSNCSIDDLLIQENYQGDNLRNLIEMGKYESNSTKSIVLPEVIFSPEDIILFEMFNAEGNYITNNKVKGEKIEIKDMKKRVNLNGKIVFIESADPGFDWIFSYKIGGFITKFGGANSHMAIRANELCVPAIIGVGTKKYDFLLNYDIIEIDCLQRKVEGK